MKADRVGIRVAATAAAALLLAFSGAGCDREDQAELEEELGQLGQEAEKAWEEAKPKIEEGVREGTRAVGKGVEAAGEALQKSGEKLQQEVRDTSASTLPDTVTRDTMVLE